MRTDILSVRINLDKTQFREVDHLNELSEEYIEAVWYTYEDYNQIKQSIKPIIREMMRNKGMGSDGRQHA